MALDVVGVAELISQPRFLISFANDSLLAVCTWKRDALCSTIAGTLLRT